MSDFTNNDLCLKLADSIVSNFNILFDYSEINYEIEFELATKILDEFVSNFYVQKDKTSESYEKSKKNFSKVLACNFKFLKDKLNLSSLSLTSEQTNNFLNLFEEGPNKHWVMLLVIIVSYLSFVKQSNRDPNINYSGMIDKLTNKIEEYSNVEDSESENSVDFNELNEDEDINVPIEDFSLDTNPQELLDQLKSQLPPTSTESTSVMKNLLGDIKGMLNGGNLESSNILDLSKNLSKKYETMIEKGDVNITDLFSGVVELLNNPDAIGDEFNDLDTDNLPNPDELVKQMASDPSLKEAMSMMGGMSNSGNSKGGLNMGMLGAMMSGLMGGGNQEANPNDPKTVQELEKEIERMMNELQEDEEDANSNIVDNQPRVD